MRLALHYGVFLRHVRYPCLHNRDRGRSYSEQDRNQDANQCGQQSVACDFTSFDGDLELDPKESAPYDGFSRTHISSSSEVAVTSDMSLIGIVVELKGSKSDREALDYALMSLFDKSLCLKIRPWLSILRSLRTKFYCKVAVARSSRCTVARLLAVYLLMACSSPLHPPSFSMIVSDSLIHIN
jgi:hypothetical protein